MALERRVTLRCLVNDLVSDWTNADHYRSVQSLRDLVTQCLSGEVAKSTVSRHLRTLPRLNALSHPLLRHFSSYFGSDYDPSKLESISGLSDPHWWKQKTQQWRGAATDHSKVTSDSVWLCAAGIRRDGDISDFYKSFTRRVKNSGVDSYLPTDADDLLLELDDKATSFDAWVLQIHCSTLALLAESRRRVGETVTMQFPRPSRHSENKPSSRSANEPIGEISLSITRIYEDGAELDEVFLVAKILNQAEVTSVDLAGQFARAAVQSDTQEWASTVFVEDSFAFSALVDPRAIEQAEHLETEHELPSDFQPTGLRIGLRSHYTQKNGIVNARVDGSAVESLCGYWFVPIKDHEHLEKCPRCVEQHQSLK